VTPSSKLKCVRDPDIIVLAAGGVLGEAWMNGVLAGLSDGGVDVESAHAYVGTSAGSIVAARMVSGHGPRQPPSAADPRDEDVFADDSAARRATATALSAMGTIAQPLAGALLSTTAPAGALARAAVLSRLPRNGTALHDVHARVERWGAEFDGRLLVCAVDRRSGRRVVFGAPGSPRTTVADAVQASCSIPAIFDPVRIGDRDYVDGGAWSLTNLDVAPARSGDHVLCLSVAANSRRSIGSPIGAMFRGFDAASGLEAAAVRSRGATVQRVGPDRAVARALGPSLMDPRPRDEVHAGGHRQGLALAAR